MKDEKFPVPVKALCYRCEHRAKFHETLVGPRYECGDISKGVFCCYMYQPVLPVVLVKSKGDKRPIAAGNMISARMEGIGVAEPISTELKEVKIKNKKAYVIWHNYNED